MSHSQPAPAGDGKNPHGYRKHYFRRLGAGWRLLRGVGIDGISDTGGSAVGGLASTGDGVGGTSASGNGVHGVSGPAGPGVLAENTAGGTALKVSGKAAISRSGVLTVAAGKASTAKTGWR